MAVKFRSQELYKLAQSGVRTTYSKGQIIQSTEGQSTMNFVTKGYIKRYLISNSGQLGVEVIYGPGDFFPLTIMLESFFKLGIYEGPEVYFYEAMNETTVYTIDVDILADAVAKDPGLYKDLLCETGRRLQTILSSLENIALRSTYNRLAHQLTFFAQYFGERTKSGVKIAVPFTSRDLADVMRLDYKDVEKCLTQLREKELIKFNKYIIITDLERLQEEAHS
jgi:CRP-like cAMP-binding protein